MKKCLLVNNGYPTHQNPNYSTYTRTIEECLQNSGLEVSSIVIKYNKRITILYKLIKYIVFWLRLLLVDQRQYDIVYVNIPPFAWTIFLNITYNPHKTVIHWHGDDVVIKTLFLDLMRSLILLRTSSCIHVSPSQYFKKIMIKELCLNDNQIIVSPSGGVDVDIFRKFNHVNKELSVLGVASGMTKGKGSDLVISILNNIPMIEARLKRKVILKIIDYGEDINLYHKYLTENQSVELVPRMSKQEMPKFYGNIDLLIMGSVRSESLGLVILEAMSCGKPVVCFNKFAFPEFVIPGISGELVEYSINCEDNTKAFVKAITKMIGNIDNYHPREIIINSYSKESVVQQYKKMFQLC